MDNAIIKFECSPDGLYQYSVSKGYQQSLKEDRKDIGTSNLISTVTENRQGYTLRQFERAKEARRLYHIVGTPTVENFKSLLRMNVIKNCPVTVEDINISEKIFGPDMSCLKGKSTRRKPKPVRQDLIEIPKELIAKHHDIELCMDTMYVNECGMLTAIDRTIKFRSLIPMNTKQHDEYYRALDQILRLYNQAGFVIKTIHCDGEYRGMMEKVDDDLDVNMNFTNAQDHVPEAERNNRTIKERIRAAYHRLPYKAIPRIMIRYLAMIQANQLNLFPVKGGVSSYYSPRMILNQTNLDYNKHCVVPFGAYVQANHESSKTSSNVQRTLDAIYLRPTQNQQGGHELMDLNSGQLITRNIVHEIPVTDVVIKAVETMAYQQGFKSLKFKNRNGIIYHDADWIAGVDYDDDEENEDNDEQYYDNEDEEIEDQLEQYEQIDPDEIDDIIQDARQNTNPNVQQGNANANEQELEHPEEQQRVDEQTRRSTRETRPIERLEPKMSGKSYMQQKKKVNFESDVDMQLEYCHNLVTQTQPNEGQSKEYSPTDAMLMARLMYDLNTRIVREGASFAQQYLLNKGLKIFGQKGRDASKKEMDQLHRRSCFTPISIAEMTQVERRKAQQALMFLGEKRDGTIKGRMVYNGKPTREWLSREDSASPTAALESIMLTAVIDAHEGRDVMTCDIPNAFIQALMPEVKDGDERVMMKITGVLVDMLVELNPELYGPYVVYEKNRKVLYVQVIRAIYGMLEAALLWYKKFRGELEQKGFRFNPYDPCVANREEKGSQHTLLFHVDDLKSSHKDRKVNDQFDKWLQHNYGEHGEVTIHRGKIHEYLGMEIDYTTKGKVKIGMIEYVANMLNDFPEKIKSTDTAITPASDGLFNEGQGKKLDQDRADAYHTMVAKALFLCKRARPDIQPTIAVLCTRVKGPNEADWAKLVRLMKYLNGTRDLKLTLSADNLHCIKWYVDASFAVHPDYKSDTGATMSYGDGDGAVQSISRKQKLNTKSSTESELVGVNNISVMILWTKLFLEEQGYDINSNILYQDNKSAILLETNGKKSSGKRTRALNIRYFFLTDQVEKGNVSIVYCPTDDMIGDFHTKPLQGEKFRKFRNAILGCDVY
ncbi:polyprotein of Ty1/Copia retrotransposon [uncultured Marinobacter sp.]|uniref:Ty1/Copia family ribonuclease HI n=1 Tax=uncultured Marinobacter sp. TaxID=187379 RepID=UPI002597A251|nr:polyprotein of Ty1/Copia retrotransposon [uncultured Marinobacter sp.]